MNPWLVVAVVLAVGFVAFIAWGLMTAEEDPYDGSW